MLNVDRNVKKWLRLKEEVVRVTWNLDLGL
jgi:hypothetical protein